MDIMNLDTVETVLDIIEYADGILAAVPCTDFTVSGAWKWDEKDRSGQTQQSLEYVYQVLKLVDLFRPTDPDYEDTFFWALENPVGRLPRLVPELEAYGKAWYFHPYEFSGYLVEDHDLVELSRIRQKNGENITEEEFEFILKTNAYTKKTGLWGEFNRNIVKKPVQPVKACPQGSFTQKYGGKSEMTKEKRSITPAGFAQAFYDANKGYKWTENCQFSYQLSLF